MISPEVRAYRLGVKRAREIVIEVRNQFEPDPNDLEIDRIKKEVGRRSLDWAIEMISQEVRE